jgi:uncharacterized protein HemX
MMLFGSLLGRGNNRHVVRLVTRAHSYAPTLGKFKGSRVSRRSRSTSEATSRSRPYDDSLLLGLSGIFLTSALGIGAICYSDYAFYFATKDDLRNKLNAFGTKLRDVKTEMFEALDAIADETEASIDAQDREIDGQDREIDGQDREIDGEDREIKPSTA